jgi:hypothetical protein
MKARVTRLQAQLLDGWGENGLLLAAMEVMGESHILNVRIEMV